MRQDIIFTSQGLRWWGWLYVPDDLPTGLRMPPLVMAPGFSAMKEKHLSNFKDYL
jgi:hypothetical protein